MTANLAIMSLMLGTLIAIPIGVLSAIRQDTLALGGAAIAIKAAPPAKIIGTAERGPPF